MSVAEEALAKAREIAARLGGGIVSDLGKRKTRDDDHLGLGSMKQQKVYIPTDSNPDINFLGLLIGPKGSTQKQLQERTGAKILFRGRGATKDGSGTGHPDDNDELHVFIEGSEEAVAKAEQEIRNILFDPEEASRLKAEQLRSINGGNSAIGGGGDGFYGPGVGSSAAAAGGDSSSNSSSGFAKEIHVPNNMVGLIIGKGGENIQRIQSQLQVQVQIAKEHEMQPGDTTRLITLKGAAPNVEEAQRRIDDIIGQQLAKLSGNGNSGNNAPQQRELHHSFVVKLPVPNDKVGIIIGKGGATIRGIQERSRSNVQIPQVPDFDNPEVRTLSVGGDSKESVDAAQMEIFMVLQQHEQGSQQNSSSGGGMGADAVVVVVPNDRVGVIIGKQGSTVKDLQSRLRVRIQIPQQPDPGSNPPVRSISITGTPDMQAMAKYEVEMIVNGTPVHSPASAAAGQYGQYAMPTAAGGAYYGAAAGAAYGMPTAYGGYYNQQQQQPAAAAYMYGAAAQMQSPYGAVAAPAAAGYYNTAANPYAAAAAVPQAAAATPDATAYYADYWHYASFYGEAAARAYYGAWSPPVGSLPPPGIVVATAEAAAANAAAQGVTLTAAATDTTAAAAAAPVAATTTAAAAVDTTAASNGDAATAAAAANGGEQSATEDAASAWEAYKKQYQEWYEAHGKALGADPNPPAQ